MYMKFHNDRSKNKKVTSYGIWFQWSQQLVFPDGHPSIYSPESKWLNLTGKRVWKEKESVIDTTAVWPTLISNSLTIPGVSPT